MMHGGLKPASSESGSMSRASASSASRRLSSETEEMASTSISVPCSRMSPRKPNVMQSAPASSSANASWPVWNRPPPRPRSLRRSHRQRAKATISMQSEPAMTAVSGRMNRSCLCSCCAWVWLGSARLRPFPAFVGSDGTGGGNDGGGEYGGQGGECGGAGGGDDAGGGRGGSGGKGGGGGEMARCVWIAKLKAAPARRAPYDRRKKNVAPPQWQSKFSPRPLGGPLSTETARASRRLSAHEYGRTARRRLSRAQGRSSIPKLAETRTLWVGSRQDGGRRRRLGGQRTHGEGRAGYHTGPRPNAMVAATAGQGWNARLVANTAAVRCPGSLRRGWSGSRAAWPLRPMCGARIGAAAAWFQLHFSVLVWGANLFFWVCGRRVICAVCGPAQAPSGWRGRPARGLTPSLNLWSAHWRRRRSVAAPFQRASVGCKAVFLGVWPPCHFHLQYTQASRLPRAGVAGTVRARPATLAPYMERALASPPLRSSLV